MEQMDASLSVTMKQEREELNIENTDDDNISLEDINNLLSISLPSLSSNKFQMPTDYNDEFLRLTTTVRAVYFSYLHKCLLTNYILCYKDKNKDVPCDQLKKCADQLELLAVRSSLEATLYRQHMLKLISDVKSHTSEKKTYKKLVIFLETPPTKVDIGIQTSNTLEELEKLDNIQSICITSNCEELDSVKQVDQNKEKEHIENGNENLEIYSQQTICNSTASPTVNSTCLEDTILNIELIDETSNKMMFNNETMKENSSMFNCTEDSSSTHITNQSRVKNENENSQDSLLQHMEDMFCGSDDSSDLMTLIEKHSGVTKADIDHEIKSILPCEPSKSNGTNGSLKRKTAIQNNEARLADQTTKKYSFSHYKEMKARESNKSLPIETETAASKHKRRINSIWFVERVYQESKVKAKMTELYLKDKKKHESVKQKFRDLFGESDDEETEPETPICIEDHLPACKERIAPWIVKYLMPYYKQKRIKDRELFKLVAKHIADMLILANTFPEPSCVSKYIETYFKNKKCIKTRQDIYL